MEIIDLEVIPLLTHSQRWPGDACGFDCERGTVEELFEDLIVGMGPFDVESLADRSYRIRTISGERIRAAR